MKWLSLWNSLPWTEISHLLIKKTFIKLDNYNHLCVASIFLQWYSWTSCLINHRIILRVGKLKPFEYLVVVKATSYQLKNYIYTQTHNTCLLVCLLNYLIHASIFSERCCLSFKVPYESVRELLNATSIGSTNSIIFKNILTNILN